MGSPRLGLAGAFAALALAATADGQQLAAHGLLGGTTAVVESREPWIAGSFGRLAEGRRPDGFVGFTRGEAQLAVEWTPSPVWLLRVHGVARSEPDAVAGSRAGLTEAFVQYRPELRPDLALRFRAGLMFLPTSRENVDPLWQSPYTLTLSAINTWIGEELRPLGIELVGIAGEPGASRIELGGMILGGSDTAGTLTAWRGWALGTRLSVVGETLPLPPLPTLAPGGPFASQLDAGTRPVDELDERPGWHVRGRYSRPGALLLQAAWTDTRGDRALHDEQYAWATRFASFAAEAELGPVRLVAEALTGETGMGPQPGGVDVSFRAVYVLASWAAADERLRLSARYDRFRNDDDDGLSEPNQESGYAWTFAGFYAPRPWLRLGLEYLALRSDRPAAAFSGSEASTDARRFQAELRLRF